MDLFEVANCDLKHESPVRKYAMTDEAKLILLDQIEPLIHEIRGQKVILDSDLAALYGVPTKRLNEQVQRNIARFPDDFLFRLTSDEAESLRSQIATLKTGRGQHRKYIPYAFTEHGAFMAASVLNSPRAVEVSVFVVRGNWCWLTRSWPASSINSNARSAVTTRRSSNSSPRSANSWHRPIRRRIKWAFTRYMIPSKRRLSRPNRPPRCSRRNAGDAPMLERFDNRPCVVRVLVAIRTNGAAIFLSSSFA
jgi:hypothetical protein